MDPTTRLHLTVPSDLAPATSVRTTGGAGFALALGDTLECADLWRGMTAKIKRMCSPNPAGRPASTDALSASAAPSERLKVQGDCVGCRAGPINTCPDGRFNAGAIIIRP
ncbi:hypothetical protein Y032_0051g2158 [Ancylostoma ceylanicum]|uniref:Uncharacterized protein n=1 Tax=Ancylostoma ceylanicum TaxID=53326 RepID=A0A016U8S7_9BILA|nr:hypothetical protein Y032_0051g2158 [Ancylostoma ceylanicum]